jgi:hypothetical protein
MLRNGCLTNLDIEWRFWPQAEACARRHPRSRLGGMTGQNRRNAQPQRRVTISLDLNFGATQGYRSGKHILPSLVILSRVAGFAPAIM